MRIALRVRTCYPKTDENEPRPQSSHFRSTGSSGSPHFSTVQNSHQGTFNSLNKLGQGNTLNKVNTTNLANKLNGNKGFNKGLNKNNKITIAKFDYGKGMNKKWFPGKSWWGYGFGCGGSYGCGGYGYDGYCGDECPWYYSACYNVCSDYVPADFSCDSASGAPDSGPLPTPAAKIVRIVNPAETQTTLGFAVNGRAYSLEAGKAQDLELADSAVVEFDRGSGNETGRYSLSEGVYSFASTPQGWELYRSNNASLPDAVTAN